MSSNIPNRGNFLRTTRSFPVESQALGVELNKAYIDIATQVNNRISGLFATSVTITGESWYLSGDNSKQQTLRQIYPITGAGNYPHGINLRNISGFSRIYGDITNGTNWYPLPYVDITATNQISIFIDPTNIVITSGSGAPSIVRGIVVLEWLSQT